MQKTTENSGISQGFGSALGEIEDKGISIDNAGLLDEYGLKNVTLSKRGDHVTLTHFIAGEQGKGNGTRFMEDLVKLADQNGWTLALTPDTSFGATSVSRLKDFYKRFGFKDNKGTNTDLETRESMVRKPQGRGARYSLKDEMFSLDDERPSVADARKRLEDPNASEFEKQAARAVIKVYGTPSGDTPGGDGVRYRIKDDAEQLVGEVGYNNRQSRQRRDAVVDFVKAVADTDELTDSKFATALGKVMRGQREYDKDTVKDITAMAKAMMDAGLLSGLDDFAVKQILTMVKDATGKESITKEANKLIDIMLKHQLKKGKSEFEKALKAKGMKQDSRGVVVQGGLDVHGQRMVKALKVYR